MLLTVLGVLGLWGVLRLLALLCRSRRAYSARALATRRSIGDELMPLDTMDGSALLLALPYRSWLGTVWWQLRSVLGHRVPFLDISVTQLLLLLSFVSFNLLLLFTVATDLNLPTRAGYLAAGNACLVMVPATRNSIITLLVSRRVIYLYKYKYFRRWYIYIFSANGTYF